MAFSLIAYGLAYVGGFLAAAAGLTVAANSALAIGISAAATIGAGLVASAIVRKLAPKPSVSSSEVKATARMTDAPRRVYVGRYLAGGIQVFFDVKGSTLYQLVVANHGQIDGFERFWVDGVPVTLTETGNWANRYVQVSTHAGWGAGGNYAPLRDNFPIWTEAHRLEKQATYLVRANAPSPAEFPKYFPKGENTLYQWEIRGAAINDNRKGGIEWSDNAALVIQHYLRHPDGYRLARTDMAWDSIDAMADWCDLPIPQRGGGTAPNMRLWGYWTLDEAPTQVLDRMASASHIRPYETQSGRIGLVGGAFGTPSCTLTGNDIRQIQTISAVDEREGYNILRVHFLSAAHKYEMIEADPWRDEARLAIEGEVVQEYQMDMCPDLSQARRLAKAQIHDDNRRRVEIITNLVGLKARWPRYHGQRHTILLDYRPEDGSGRVIAGEYEVLDHEFDPVGLECRIVLAEVDRTSMAWAVADEGAPPPPLPAVSGNPAPTLSAEARIVVTETTGGQRQAVIEVVAQAVPDREDLVVQMRHRRAGTGEWRVVAGDVLVAQSRPVADGSTHEVQARWTGVFDGVMEWRPLGTITVSVDVTPPLAPSNAVALLQSGPRVRLTWDNPTGLFYRIEIYRSTGVGLGTLIGTTGGVSGQQSAFVDEAPLTGQAARYRVRAINASGVPGPEVSTAVITA